MIEKTRPTLTLEALTDEFTQEIIPALEEFSTSPEFLQLVKDTQGKREYEIHSDVSDLTQPFNGANELGAKYFEGRVVPVLIREQDLDSNGFYNRVYICILEEVRSKIMVDGRTFFYPAIGHDWRIPDAWPKSRIIGIDPAKGEGLADIKWTRPNANIIFANAEDYATVRNHLEQQGLPTKGDLILKGSSFCLDTPPPETRYQRFAGRIKGVLGRSKPRFLSETERHNNFDNMINAYLDDGGTIIALSGEDIMLCDERLQGFQKREIISPGFQESLKRWNSIANEHTSVGIPLGFWHSHEEPLAYSRK